MPTRRACDRSLTRFDQQLYPATASSPASSGLEWKFSRRPSVGRLRRCLFVPRNPVVLAEVGLATIFKTGISTSPMRATAAELTSATPDPATSPQWRATYGSQFDTSTLTPRTRRSSHNNGVLTKDFKPAPSLRRRQHGDGIKASWYSNTLNASLALFKIDQADSPLRSYSAA